MARGPWRFGRTQLKLCGDTPVAEASPFAIKIPFCRKSHLAFFDRLRCSHTFVWERLLFVVVAALAFFAAAAAGFSCYTTATGSMAQEIDNRENTPQNDCAEQNNT